MAAMSFESDPPQVSQALKVTFPADHVLLLTFNRPKDHNAMSFQLETDLDVTLKWFSDEPSLWVVIVTGEGKSFCAGADLKDWMMRKQTTTQSEQERAATHFHGFGSLSRRQILNKPIIAAVNGGAFGGGLEMVVNCDIVIASEKAKFGFPEVTRGVIAIQGGIPRIAKNAGHQKAAEALLTGRIFSAAEARDTFNFVNYVVPPDQVLPKALEIASLINANSPDAVQSTKQGLLFSQTLGHEEVVARHIWSHETWKTFKGENINEGLKAFVEKRAPRWKNPAKL